MSVNEITGDRLVSSVPTNKYREGYDAIFGKARERVVPSYEGEYLARSRAVIAEWWDDMPVMFEKLDELEEEYKGKD